jgi:hypothetical protein
MCIAIFSESGVGYPTKEIFKRCWDINHDGAGFAYLTTEDEWHIRKGFMTFDAFWEVWEEAAFTPENTVVIHLRWGTSGKMVPGEKNDYGGELCHPGACHPFPITDDVPKMLTTEITTKRIVMHNGVVGAGKGDMSDTMIFIKDYIDPMIPYMSDKKVNNLLTVLLDAEGYSFSSRWWIADGLTSYLLGNWIRDEETNIWYSKDDYLEPKAWEKNETSRYWGNDYSSRNATGQRIPEINLVSHLVASDFKTKKLKTFSFAKWNQFERARLNEKKVETKHEGRQYELTDDDRTIEVYNSDDELMSLIDARTGEAIWEVDLREEALGDDPKETRHCNDCGASPTRAVCQGGLCPYCYGVIFPIDGIPTETVGDTPLMGLLPDTDDDCCPTCGERSYLIDSTFDLGDTECCRCGCLFASTIKGRDGIVGWNEDTKASHDEAVHKVLKDISIDA